LADRSPDHKGLPANYCWQRPQFIRLVNAGGKGADIVLFGAGAGAGAAAGAAFSTAFSAAASHERHALGSL